MQHLVTCVSDVYRPEFCTLREVQPQTDELYAVSHYTLTLSGKLTGKSTCSIPPGTTGD